MGQGRCENSDIDLKFKLLNFKSISRRGLTFIDPEPSVVSCHDGEEMWVE
jgi:hypothetical protein